MRAKAELPYSLRDAVDLLGSGLPAHDDDHWASFRAKSGRNALASAW